MNYARNENPYGTGVEAAIARFPAHVRAAVNRRRISMGLEPVLGTGESRRLAAAHHVLDEIARRPVRDRAIGWSGRAAAPAAPKSISRIVIAPCYGTASARSIGEPWGEHISFRAFGTADELNARAGMWQLTHGHGGAVLAVAGPRLRAVESEIGPLLVWEPRYSDAAVDVLSAMLRNGGRCGASVEFRSVSRKPSRIVTGTTFVAEARLDAVALLVDSRHRPAYSGSVALLRTRQRRDDPAALRDHVVATVAAARAAERRGR